MLHQCTTYTAKREEARANSVQAGVNDEMEVIRSPREIIVCRNAGRVFVNQVPSQLHLVALRKSVLHSLHKDGWYGVTRRSNGEAVHL